MLLSHNMGASHGDNLERRRARRALEQGQTHRVEVSTKAQRNLGDPDPPAIGKANAGSGAFQLGHR